MQRYSDGLAVPKQKMDIFTGKTTGTGGDAGKVTCELTYTPKGINHIVIPTIVSDAGVFCHPRVLTLTGKSLLIKLYQFYYDKTNTLGTSNTGDSAAAEPHTHTIYYSTLGVIHTPLDAELLEIIRVNYTVA